ncbi:MAG: septal ring lytic transglycosylase RlpA family protein [Bacteroidota bacterium]|nr:septal ring lytic transglycosylase RlpA family protein [Bacteroidota bacterium]
MNKLFLLLTILITTVRVSAQQDSVQVKHTKTVTGTASFYSLSLNGTKTASGERFHNDQMTAASNSFKLGTRVKVTNLRNGRTVVVRINDRMHKKMAKKGRVIDLSRAAAKKLGFIKRGLTKVRVEEISSEE